MTSLRRRLYRVLLVLLGGLFLQWLVADRTISYAVESEMESRLRHDADALLACVEFGAAGEIRCDRQAPGTIYSTEYSGHYYVIAANGGRVRSASFGDAPTFALRTTEDDSLDYVAGPREQPLLLLTLHTSVRGRPVTLAVAEDLSPMRRDLARFRLAFLLLSVVILTGATALQGRELRWALRPLDQVRDAVQEMHQHGTRIDAAAAPAEIRPLIDEVNRMLAVVSRRLEQSRTAIGNLSHAVKTPLTAVFRLLDDPRLNPYPDLRQQLQAQAQAIQTRIERELKRARLAGETATTANFDCASDLPALIGVLEQIHRDKHPDIDWVAPPGALPLDRQDVMELVGNLADNACKWARQRVHIEIRTEDGVHILVSDDGPGCSPGQIERLCTRGERIDESMPGYGLGLAIARDIVDFAGGQLSFSRSASLGGLEVTAAFPSSRRERAL